jgi:hypothetical protein
MAAAGQRHKHKSKPISSKVVTSIIDGLKQIYFHKVRGLGLGWLVGLGSAYAMHAWNAHACHPFDTFNTQFRWEPLVQQYTVVLLIRWPTMLCLLHVRGRQTGALGVLLLCNLCGCALWWCSWWYSW